MRTSKVDRRTANGVSSVTYLEAVPTRKARKNGNKMSTEKIVRTVFDLDSFDDVLLQKEFEFSPVTSIEQALAALGNDSAKLLEVVNDGLRSEVRRKVSSEAGGWLKVNEDDSTAPYTGTMADSKVVNTLVLTLAKTFVENGDWKSATPDMKKAAKSEAMATISASEKMKAGLRKSAATATQSTE